MSGDTSLTDHLTTGNDDTPADDLGLAGMLQSLDYERIFQGTKLEGMVSSSDDFGEAIGAEVGALLGRKLGAALGASLIGGVMKSELSASAEGEETETEGDETGEESETEADGMSAEEAEAEEGSDGDGTEGGGESESAEDVGSVEEIRNMDYDSLQTLAKVVGVKANLSQEEMTDQIIGKLGLNEQGAES
jgi:hypothetical protein